MKKVLLSIVILFAFGLWSNAQVIENFESLSMNLFSGGTNGAISVVANPDASGINTSGYVAKMVRGFDGDPWAGWYATLPTPVNVTDNKYVHLKIWKPRVSPVVFKYEGAVNSGDVNPIQPQALIGQWEELVFDMSVVSGDYVKIVLIPDFENPLTLTEDIILYYDDLYVNNDPTVGSAPVQVMEDFEHIALNLMLNGPDDLSTMTMIDNPDMSGVNVSNKVIKFFRDKDGFLWDGFWSALPAVIDVTTNKFVHVKVWKSRISPLKFKIEGGTAGTIEVDSKYPQTLTNAWEDIVFDFSEKTGTYPVIAFLPDFLETTEDLTMYFDDIILNNDPNPIAPPSQKISVNMNESGMTAGSPVWIAGTFGGIHGTWAEPGTNANNEMTDPDNDGIYSINVSLPEGLYAFKFFWANGWGNGDPAPGGDRTLQFTNTTDVLYKWGVDGVVGPPSVEFNVNMSQQITLGTFNPETDYVDVAGSFNEWNGENHHLTAVGAGLYNIVVENFTAGDNIEFKFRINGDWATSEFPNGGANRTYTVLDGPNVITVWYNDEEPAPTGDVTLADFEDGTNGALTIHVMGCGDYDNPELHPVDETFMVIDNPDPTGLNTSAKVLKFIRRGTTNGGMPWGGFYAGCEPQADVTTSKYVTIQLWKSRISPIAFKLEGGAAGNSGDVFAMNDQVETNKWEEFSFDYSALTGPYPTVVLIPDFETPDLTIAADIDIFIDNIRVTEGAAGIGNVIKVNNVNVYPNPVTSDILITSSIQMKNVEIINLAGQVVKSFNIDNHAPVFQANVSDLVSGLYFIRVSDGTTTYGTKMLKQ